MEELKFSVDGITLHCDPEVSCNFIALTVLSFDMILRQGEELETGVPWFWSAPNLTQRGKGLTEQFLFTIYDPDRKYEDKTDGTQSSNPHGLAGFKTVTLMVWLALKLVTKGM